MNTKIIYRALLGATCFFSMACGAAKNSTDTVAHVQESQASNGSEWQAIYFDWAAGEIYPEDACAEGRVTLKRDRTLEVRDCDEVRRVKISESDLAAFEQEISFILSSLERPITCNGDAIADYEQNWKLVDETGETIQIYRFDIQNTCGRVPNVNELNDFLYDLKEEYFPRAEEGEYQD